MINKVTLFHSCHHIRSYANDIEDLDEFREVVAALEKLPCETCEKERNDLRHQEAGHS
jgi:hypothetical protein